MVHLVEAGYSHAEVAEMMGYAGARSVTTTMNRIRTKITEHVGSREEVEELLSPSMDPVFAQIAFEPLAPNAFLLPVDGVEEEPETEIVDQQ